MEEALVVEEAKAEGVEVAVAFSVLSDVLPAEALGSGIGERGRLVADAFDHSVDLVEGEGGQLLGEFDESAPAEEDGCAEEDYYLHKLILSTSIFNDIASNDQPNITRN